MIAEIHLTDGTYVTMHKLKELDAHGANEHSYGPKDLADFPIHSFKSISVVGDETLVIPVSNVNYISFLHDSD